MSFKPPISRNHAEFRKKPFNNNRHLREHLNTRGHKKFCLRVDRPRNALDNQLLVMN
jgi:hypothetical protein